MAEKVLEVMDDKIERNVKDSVFCDLFKDPENILELYQALYPEDTTTTVNDLTLITLSRVIVRTMFNDLGFIVGNRLIVLVEAQSTWTENILSLGIWSISQRPTDAISYILRVGSKGMPNPRVL